MKKLILLICLAAAVLTILSPAHAENDGDCVYSLLDERGNRLTRRAVGNVKP